ncbi:hypothetical protein RCL_jg19855.t1 [Rhizophagus clarus]|uniref:Uncharacterized protein n=1 Tax=Rhizophagus clarus TaxID=94130 RepID=A0A8H3LD74_9GLOM|nr:hypothetical protein RCL_jg19855.t1 [Rhizophagus clarus]
MSDISATSVQIIMFYNSLDSSRCRDFNGNYFITNGLILIELLQINFKIRIGSDHVPGLDLPASQRIPLLKMTVIKNCL